MSATVEIATAFAEQMRAGANALRDSAGAPASLEVPLSDVTTVELGVNPRLGFYLRLRTSLAQVSAERREALMADLVGITASTRFRSGWIGGCENGDVATLSVGLDPAGDAAAIARLIETATSLLRPGRSEAHEAAFAESLSIGETWLRI